MKLIFCHFYNNILSHKKTPLKWRIATLFLRDISFYKRFFYLLQTIAFFVHSYNIINNNEAQEEFFVFGNTQPLKQHRIDTNKIKYFKLSNIPEITNHEFRHSHVSLMVNEYIKSGQTDTSKFFIMMSNRLGHTIEVMQKTYLHLFPNVQSEIISLINKINIGNF